MLALLLAGALMSSSLADDVAELEAVTWEMERRGLIEPDFGAWQKRHRSRFDWTSPHFSYVFRRLDGLTAGTLERVLLQVAVRHGKTESVKGYMAYRLEKDPSTRILFGSYGERQALKVSREVRRIARTRGVEISPDRDAAGEWETTDGGGMLAVGAGTGVASVNADLIVIDDPIGSREQAESEAHRDRVWDWITTDILARAEPHTQAIFSMPRWHADDPAGRMQDQHVDLWTLVDLPGVAEDDDPLGRKVGELLWPSHRPPSWIDRQKVLLGPYGFASAVQCRPTPREGGQFDRAWFDLSHDSVPRGSKMIWVRHWDLAGTPGGGAYTCGVLIGVRITDGTVWVKNVVRGQWAAGERNGIIKATAKDDADALKSKHAVLYQVEQEPGSGGKDQAAAVVRLLSGYRVEARTASGDKFLRADPFAGAAKNGDVRVLSGPWRETYLAELEMSGPGAKYLDQMDASSGAYNRLMEMLESYKGASGVGFDRKALDDESLEREPAWRVR